MKKPNQNSNSHINDKYRKGFITAKFQIYQAVETFEIAEAYQKKYAIYDSLVYGKNTTFQGKAIILDVSGGPSS